jgi:hypothetical protein
MGIMYIANLLQRCLITSTPFVSGSDRPLCCKKPEFRPSRMSITLCENIVCQRRWSRTPASLVTAPAPQRLRRAADLAGARHHRLPFRAMIRPVLAHHPDRTVADLGRKLVRRLAHSRLSPQDLKLEVDQFSNAQAVTAAHYLAFVVGKAHSRQMDDTTRRD